MLYKNFASTWLSLHESNRFLKFVCIFLLTLNLLTLVGWLKKDTAIVLIPPSLSEKSEVAKNKASEGYKKAWGMYTAALIGNVTPENADFVLASFSGMVTGEIRSIVSEQIAQELETLKQESVSSSFDIVQVTYEPETDKVFVTGKNRMTGAGGKSSPTEQTFEFKIDVKHYSPIITHMSSYKGMPKLLSIIKKEEAKQKMQEERQKYIKK
ncbi:TraE/TraK family type IV conjugative transfer system protein [Methylicorpusculum sp.]|uniref:TraE/TraK family type IV conjugative transfer system protein n=1 Tax=Methylicorpusculum sp. TaxID=2713644 RepID=UPI002724C14D|nr:TraE/TraK family type IV conjugative transfer system protein [Methylicorpusculum sp.]MDO8845335.1 TraE/TraK family type IV conjugative transfer system protein [Methylicorpusculum sp.]MDP3529728.1 TraE/TraK family type IV conjugative transfer system protein [Methylicorpusculum sp.]MDZ4152241.1 TraE/TraK family type IV conjugative transfer system protein [Methylicorpusculum sp.]